MIRKTITATTSQKMRYFEHAYSPIGVHLPECAKLRRHLPELSVTKYTLVTDNSGKWRTVFCCASLAERIEL